MPSFHVFVYMPVLYCFDYQSFEVNFEIRKCDTSNFVLFQFFFFCSYLWILEIPYEFWIDFSVSVKKNDKTAGFDKDRMKSVGCFG